mmetsp:Transcript_18994/g.41387  ORF Transcript_18994/g.41387 Transcript_18994/m.41387 type:complete len:257 (+) Transcript_18994:186-956(+)
MNSTNNDDSEEAHRKIMELEYKEGVKSFDTTSPDTAQSPNDPLVGRAQIAETEQAKSDNPVDRCAKLSMAKTFSQTRDGVDNDMTYRSWRSNEESYHNDAQEMSKRALPSSSSTPELRERLPLEMTPSSPRKPAYVPPKQPSVYDNASQDHNYRGHSSKQARRTRLLVFIKIILKCLDCEDPSIQFEAKQIIRECTRKNREGIPGYDPLADAITSQLRMTVGELHWNRAETLMSHYLKSRSKENKSRIDMPNYAAV